MHVTLFTAASASDHASIGTLPSSTQPSCYPSRTHRCSATASSIASHLVPGHCSLPYSRSTPALSDKLSSWPSMEPTSRLHSPISLLSKLRMASAQLSISAHRVARSCCMACTWLLLPLSSASSELPSPLLLLMLLMPAALPAAVPSPAEGRRVRMILSRLACTAGRRVRPGVLAQPAAPFGGGGGGGGAAFAGGAASGVPGAVGVLGAAGSAVLSLLAAAVRILSSGRPTAVLLRLRSMRPRAYTAASSAGCSSSAAAGLPVLGASSPAAEALSLLRALPASEPAAKGPSVDRRGVPGSAMDRRAATGLGGALLLLLLLHLDR